MTKIVTHSGSFHADDVFAVATLQLYFGAEEVEVIRTRDAEVIAAGDIVLDVGGVYDPERKRFDHHQKGAPARDDGTPYAAFGLIWEHYGELVAKDSEVADSIKRRLVLPIDIGDNGIATYTQNDPDIAPILLQDIIGLLKPVEGKEAEMNAAFMEACTLARTIITRALVYARSEQEQKKLIAEAYAASDNKQVLVLDRHVSATIVADTYPDVLFLVYPDDQGKIRGWVARTVPSPGDPFTPKHPLPAEWAGLQGEALVAASGIDDAVFCHRNRFLFVAGSREDALAAVEAALAS